MNNVLEFTVTETDELTRLDKYLSACLPDFSRSEIQRFNVTRADGTPIKFSERIRVGDSFRVNIPAPKTEVATDNISTDFDLDILFEDDDIIVINKPRGVVMYPSAGNKTGTLVQNILAHTHLSALGGATRPGVVHRLDKDTSGVMVFAKSDAAFRELVRVFSEHDLTRKYIAFVWGVPNWEVADITGNIARSSRNRQKMTMVKTGGKPSHTEVAVVNAWSRAGISQMRCTLFTGRTHQIRVHMAHLGHPILGDTVYGNKKPVNGLQGQCLHAVGLRFIHPRTGEPVELRCSLPEEFESQLRKLRRQ